MKFTCEKSVLCEAASNVMKAVSSKSTLPVLEGINLKAMGDTLYLTGYDLELGIETEIPSVVSSEGQIVLHANYLYNIIRKMPGDDITISVDEKMRTTIESGISRFQILGFDSEDYPKLPEEDSGESFLMNGQLFKNMTDMVLFAVAATDTRPVQTGALFDIENGVFQMVAVDGFRLALRKEVLVDYPDLNAHFVVPGKTLSEVAKLIDNRGLSDEETIKISYFGKHVAFEIGDYRATARLLEGEFLNYKNSIPSENNTTVRLDTRTMIDSIERTSLLITERLKSPLRLQFHPDKISISCISPVGRSYDEVICAPSGEEILMGFNHRYLLDAFRNSMEDTILFETNGSLSPVKITSGVHDKFTYIVLPLRLKNETN